MLQIPLLGVNRHEESYDSPYDRRSEVYRQLAYEYAKEQTQQQKQQPIWTVPNLLTFLRLVLVPVVMALWYAQHELAQMLVAVLFVTASVTDWLDGYIARKVR
jgi:CDP-diacylglycerol--glycerol-3-phosphate 3-phosphatidyltransferase